MRKHRGTLFNQLAGGAGGGITAAMQVRQASMAFFMSCIALIETGDAVGALIWEIRVKLLEIVDKEMLFDSSGVQMVNKAESVLRRNRGIAIQALTSLKGTFISDTIHSSYSMFYYRRPT